MTTLFASKADTSRIVLYGDSLYCLAIGLALALFAAPIADVAGLLSTGLVRFTGLGLIVWGIAMASAVYSDRVRTISLMAIIVKIATLVAIEAMLTTSMVSAPMLAKAAAIGMAGIIGIFAIAQYVGYQRQGA